MGRLITHLLVNHLIRVGFLSLLQSLHLASCFLK